MEKPPPGLESCVDASCDGSVQENQPDSDIKDRRVEGGGIPPFAKSGEGWGTPMVKPEKKVPVNAASYLFVTTSSRLWSEPFAADSELWLCCWSTAMALATPFPYAGSAFEQLPI
jgi:hypothetical protein